MRNKFDGSNYPGKIDASLPANMVCGVYDAATSMPKIHPGGFLWVPDKFKPSSVKVSSLAEKVEGATVCDTSSGEGGEREGMLDIPFRENDHEGFLAEFKGKVPNLETKLVLVCRRGNRAASACALLEQAGYKNLTNGLNANTINEAERGA
jgi:rhodanese-related sulfurtransferase